MKILIPMTASNDNLNDAVAVLDITESLRHQVARLVALLDSQLVSATASVPGLEFYNPSSNLSDWLDEIDRPDWCWLPKEHEQDLGTAIRTDGGMVSAGISGVVFHAYLKHGHCEYYSEYINAADWDTHPAREVLDEDRVSD